jgi:hypothetical protein
MKYDVVGDLPSDLYVQLQRDFQIEDLVVSITPNGSVIGSATSVTRAGSWIAANDPSCGATTRARSTRMNERIRGAYGRW